MYVLLVFQLLFILFISYLSAAIGIPKSCMNVDAKSQQ